MYLAAQYCYVNQLLFMCCLYHKMHFVIPNQADTITLKLEISQNLNVEEFLVRGE